jgi:hypothetical protein
MNTDRCPLCGRPFEVVFFQGRYYTSCCDTELATERENQ